MLIHLFAAEWLKLSRRPLSWVLLTVFLGTLLLYLGLWALVVALHQGSFSEGRIRLEALRPEQLAELQLQLSFPGIFGAVLGQINSIGGILAIILAGGALGSEYNWGTLRTTLSRAPNRGAFLLAKLIAVMLVIAVGALSALAMGALFALVASSWLGLPRQLSGHDLLLLPLGLLRALFVILPYVLLTFACASFGRSVLAGVGGGLIFLALDVSAGSLGSLGVVSDLVLVLVNLLLQPNINTMVVLNSQLYGLDQSVLASSLNLELLPSPLQATLVIGTYCGLFYAAAWRSLAQHDISGAQ